MKIVIDARELRTSSGRYVERLLHYLQKIDKRHDYAVLLKPKDIDGWQPTNKRFSVVACPHKEFTFAEQIAMRKQLKHLKPDLVHFAFTQQPVLYRGNTLTTVHDLTTARFDNPAKNWFVFRLKRLVYRGVIKIVARKSRALITPSEYVKEDLARFARINSRKITVTLEAADPLADKAQPVDDLQDTQFIMYVGRPNPHKNLNRLVAAFAIIKKTNPDLKLVLVGKTDSNYRQLARYVKKLGIEDVVFTGFLPDAQVRWLYEHTAAYVFPSLSEGFGLPALEAMVHGAPVASSNATCLPEVYGDAALYFDPYDPQAMAKTIDQIISSEQQTKELVSLGKKRAASFSWERMANQTLALYSELLGE